MLAQTEISWPPKQVLEVSGQNLLSSNPCVSPTAIEPPKEEADENYNSVNTRMKKTQVGFTFLELGHFIRCFLGFRVVTASHLETLFLGSLSVLMIFYMKKLMLNREKELCI